MGLLAATMLGASLLLVAELTTLFSVQRLGFLEGPANDLRRLPSLVGDGADRRLRRGPGDRRVASRRAGWPSSAIGVLGVVALLIALLGDLPDATASGLILTSAHYVEAKSTPSAGFVI